MMVVHVASFSVLDSREESEKSITALEGLGLGLLRQILRSVKV